MARGWESKAVESQLEEKGVRDAEYARRYEASPEVRARRERIAQRDGGVGQARGVDQVDRLVLRADHLGADLVADPGADEALDVDHPATGGLEQHQQRVGLAGHGVPGRPGPNVVRLSGRRMDQYAATTINRRTSSVALESKGSANHTRLPISSRTTYNVSWPFSGCKPSIVSTNDAISR